MTMAIVRVANPGKTRRKSRKSKRRGKGAPSVEGAREMKRKKKKSSARRRKGAARKSNPGVRTAAPHKKRRKARRKNPSTRAHAHGKVTRRRTSRRRNPSSPILGAAMAAAAGAGVAVVGGALVNRFVPGHSTAAMALLAVGSCLLARKSPVFATAAATGFATAPIAQVLGPQVDKLLGSGMHGLSPYASQPQPARLQGVSSDTIQARMAGILADRGPGMAGVSATAPIY